jgi:hypothetical protein
MYYSPLLGGVVATPKKPQLENIPIYLQCQLFVPALLELPIA